MERLFNSLKLLAILALALTFGLAAGCGSNDSTGSGDSSAAAEEESTSYNPQIGMTKAEIEKMYNGQPDQKSIDSDGGEIWTYHTNAGARFIPYNYGYRPKYDTITFGADGKVVSFRLNH